MAAFLVILYVRRSESRVPALWTHSHVHAWKELISGRVTRERFQMKFQMKFQKDCCILELSIYPLCSSHRVSLTVIIWSVEYSNQIPIWYLWKKWDSCQKFLSQHNNKVVDKSMIIGGGKPGLRKANAWAMGLLCTILLKNCWATSTPIDQSFVLYAIVYPITINCKSDITVSWSWANILQMEAACRIPIYLGLYLMYSFKGLYRETFCGIPELNPCYNGRLLLSRHLSMKPRSEKQYCGVVDLKKLAPRITLLG